jgi:hypothetical protein
LERHIRATIQITPARSDSLDKLLRTHNPGDSPSGKSETLGQTINDEHIVLIYILDVLGGGDSGAVTVRRVVISTIELIHDQSGSVTTDVLNLSKFRVLYDFSRGVTWVRCQDDGGTARDFIGDLVWVDVVSVFL